MSYDLDKLVPGQVYFMVVYYDNGARIPLIETRIFAGKNLLSGDDDLKEISWYFQDPDDYLERGLFNAQLPLGDGVILAETGILEGSLHDFYSLQVFLEEIKQRSS